MARSAWGNVLHNSSQKFSIQIPPMKGSLNKVLSNRSNDCRLHDKPKPLTGWKFHSFQAISHKIHTLLIMFNCSQECDENDFEFMSRSPAIS